MASEVDILGKGWSYPFRFTATGGVARAQGMELVKMGIAQILGTRVGSRVIDRDFGSNTKDTVMEPIDEITANRLKFAVSNAITRWDKRVRLISVEVILTRANEGVLEAHVKFELISTQEVGSLVFPFVIDPSMRVQNAIILG